MKKIIHNLRKQPEDVRRNILHVLTFLCAFALFSFWVYSLGTNFSDEDTQANIKEDTKPFSVLKDNLPTLW